MIVIDGFDPSAAHAGSIEVGAADPGSKILLYNRSQVSIKLNFQNGSTALLHSGEANFWVLDGTTETIDWIQYDMLATSTPPISKVSGMLYGAQEKITGTYPVALQYQTTVGNPIPVNTSSSVDHIINDGNVAPTSIIESTPMGAPGSTWAGDNTGNLLIKQYVSGVLTTLLQLIVGVATGGASVKLSDATHQTEVLGDLKVDGTTFVGALQAFANMIVNGGITATALQLSGGASQPKISADSATGNINLDFPAGTFAVQLNNHGFRAFNGTLQLGINANNDILDASSGGTFLKATGGNIQFQNPNGTTIAQVVSDGIQLQSNKHLKWQNGVDTLSQTHSFTGNASGTYNHGCVNPPFIVLPISSTANNTTTFGYDTVTSTQVHITVFASMNFTALALCG